ncbi:MAG: LysM repeat protein [Verrucomicrobiales bacterium]|jgi:LysM repeat protein
MKKLARISLVLFAGALLTLSSCTSKRGANPYAQASNQGSNPYSSYPATYGANQPTNYTQAAPQGGGYPSNTDYVDVQPVQQQQPTNGGYVQPQPQPQNNPYDTGVNPYGNQGGYTNQPAPYVPPAPSQPTSYTPAPPQQMTPVSGYRGTYTVVKGDTLYSIGRRHGTTADAIMSANRLSSTLILPGESLNIP